MVRRHTHHFRNPGPTENEIALQWEIDRLRGEIRSMRQMMGADEFGHVPGDRLTGEALARFYEKLGRMNQRLLEQWVPSEEHCLHCGGVSPERLKLAFAEAAQDQGEDEAMSQTPR